MAFILPRSPLELERLATDILELSGLPDATFDLHIVGDAELTALMGEHKGVAAPTNTLAFPASESGSDETDPDHLGELFLSAHALEREIFLYGQHPDEHLVRLLAHGVLHLAGFDHGEMMEQLTETAVENFAGKGA